MAFPTGAIHRAYGYFMDYMARIPSPEAVAGQHFTVGFSFTGQGGGDWTIHLGHGHCQANEGRAATDVRLTMSPETFIRMMFGITSPMMLTLTRKIKVQGFGKMGTFVKLFPANTPGHGWQTTLEPTPTATI